MVFVCDEDCPTNEIKIPCLLWSLFSEVSGGLNLGHPDVQLINYKKNVQSDTSVYC